jgi:hypothetical protein
MASSIFRKSWGWFRYGYMEDNGLHAIHGYRAYPNNISGHAGPFRFDGKVKDCLHLGSGKYRRFTDKAIAVPAGKKTLAFSVALDAAARNKKVPYKSILKIYANGKEIFSKFIPNSKKWQEYQADVSAFAGKNVIFHFEFGFEKPEQEKASVNNHVIKIGDLNVQ